MVDMVLFLNNLKSPSPQSNSNGFLDHDIIQRHPQSITYLHKCMMMSLNFSLIQYSEMFMQHLRWVRHADSFRLGVIK